MPFNYQNLDARTRKLMLAEIDRDGSNLYLSDNLSALGKSQYPALLRFAAKQGNDESLGLAIRNLLNSHSKPRKLKSGGFSKPPKMAVNAHQVLAEGEFNRFYIRAVCLRAIEDNISHVTAYRAKQVISPRSASQRMIGARIAADTLLNDLRSNPGVDTALGLPPGPNSGISVKLP